MMNRRVLVSFLLLSALLAPAAIADANPHGVANEMLLNGVAAPSGSSLFSDSLLTTMDKAATVNLVNGQTVVLAPNSAASFSASQAGEIYVAVEEGSASYRRSDGVVVAALENELLITSQDGVQQGEPVEQGGEETTVCVLTSPTDAAGAEECLAKPKKRGCSWSKQTADLAELDEQGARYYEADSAFDCKDRKGWIALLGTAAVGGLGSGGTAALVGGAVLGSAVIIDQVDESPSSPIN